ncbi:PAX-interacting protein 1-like [Photinus pyralis]|uniref:PAX-interacting protein 1-like n=1 Tax=Photinus pyralis TaxID=7054 RepID=UPI0012673987|nr:PAX-interacting protein 1-like [Photinus pyralis]
MEAKKVKLGTQKNAAAAAPPVSILQDILLQSSQQLRTATNGGESSTQTRPPTPETIISLADSDIEDEFGRLFENITPPSVAAAVVPPQLPPPQQFGGKDLSILRRETNDCQVPLQDNHQAARVQEVRPHQQQQPAPPPPARPQQPHQAQPHQLLPPPPPPQQHRRQAANAGERRQQQQQSRQQQPPQVMMLPPTNLRELKDNTLHWLQELHVSYQQSETMLSNRAAQLQADLFETNNNLETVRANLSNTEQFIRCLDQLNL